MGKKSVKLTHLGTDNSHTVSSRIREHAKLHLSRVLQRWLIDNRQSASDLARKTGLPRDSISRYVLRKSFPDENSLRRLAKGMDMETKDLAPDRHEILIDPDNPAAEMVVNENQPGMAWIRVNQLTTFETAQKILALLHAANDTPDGKRGR